MPRRSPVLAAALASLALASVAAVALGVKLPRYKVEISLSTKAAQNVKTSGETVRVAASYFGTAKPGVVGDEADQIQMGREEADIQGPGSVRLGKIAIETADLRKIIEKEPQVLINVFTGRKVLPDNLLDCGIFQNGISVAARRTIRISCKLIGE